MTDDQYSDNILPFVKPADRSVLRPHDFRSSGKIIRLHVRGPVQTDIFLRWLMEKAIDLHLNGWARTGADGFMDMLIAGGEGDVDHMVECLKKGPRPVDMLMVQDVAVQGDEPLWSGFHHLSPAHI